MTQHGIRLSTFLEHGIDQIFYCWVRRAKTEGLAESFELHKPSEFVKISWTETEYTFFKESKYVKPKGLYTVSLRSKELFSYGIFQIITKLPNWKDGPSLWFGFEADDLFGGGVIHFQYYNGKLRAHVGAWPRPIAMDLTSFALPTDYSSTRHTYSIYIHDGIALWYVDNKLRACALLAHQDIGEGKIIVDGPPYSLAITSMLPSTNLAVLLDIDGGDINKEWVWEDFHPWQIRVLPGQPKTILALDLYKHCSEEQVKKLKLEKEIITHPIPTLPFDKVNLYIKSTEKTNITIEYLTRNLEWQEYDKVDSIDHLRYSITDNLTAIRLRIIPTKACKITTAEALLK